MTYHFRMTLYAAVVLGVMLVGQSAMAFVIPLDDIDGRLFPTHIENVQVFGVRTSVTPTVAGSAGGVAGYEWAVDTEVRLRNISEDSKQLLVAMDIAEGAHESSRFFVGGQRVDADIRTLGRDPGIGMVDKGRYPVVSIELPSLEMVTIRLQTTVSSENDEFGQTVLKLPYADFRLYSGPIGQSFVQLVLPERPIGFVSTLKQYTFYDEPENYVSWFHTDWEPEGDLEAAWLGTWPALLLVAAVEKCPKPLRVVRDVMTGSMSNVREYLSDFSDADLEFCKSLPLVTHGYKFSSSEVREQLSQLQVNRYVGGRTERGSLYRVNAHFERSELSEPERIYYHTLQSELSD